MTTTTLITGEELLEMPSNGHHYELVKGELIEMTPAGYGHGEIHMDLGTEINLFVRQHDLGRVAGAETGFRLSRDPDTVRAPDVSFVTWERRNAQENLSGYFEGAPDLAVEVVSPNDRAGEIQSKVTEWLEAGTLLVWVVYPRSQRVLVHSPDESSRTLRVGQALDGGEVLPGFELAVSEIFR